MSALENYAANKKNFVDALTAWATELNDPRHRPIPFQRLAKHSKLPLMPLTNFLST